MKKLTAVLVAALAAGAITGCTGGQKEATTVPETAQSETAAEETTAEEATTEETTAETTEATAAGGENYDTGNASRDHTRNENGIGENELLVASFGTSYNDNRRMTIGAIEAAMETAFSDYSVRRGFTSQIIIDRVKSRDNVAIDNIGEALNRAADNGVKTLIVQPTHLMNGLEYHDLVNEVAAFSDAFEKVAIGEPLLTSEEDFQAVIKAITADTAEYDDGKTAICFMGHGTEAESNHVYSKMQEMLATAGYEHYYIGTVEAEPALEEVLAAVDGGDYEKVVLLPLMIVAGDHANNDMAGDEEDSWKSVFEKAGYEVTCVLRGLGESEAIQQIFVGHAQAAMDSLAE